MESSSFDPREFRQALGSFATGVTIITTRDGEGEPLGLTVSSFNSVSLDPPMVLWSLAKDALSLPVFREQTEYWAVNVLSTEQADLSNRFAQRGEDKFAGIETDTGVGGIPLIKNCAARFQCKTAFQYEGGDHVIFVGEVQAFDQSATAPLVFHGGKYARATHRVDRDENPRSPYLGGSFNENFLGYLLGRSHYKFYDRIRPLLKEAELSDDEFYVLSTLTLKHDMTAGQMDALMTGVLAETGHDTLHALVNRGLVESIDDSSDHHSTFQLTEEGSACALKLISAAKAVESQVTELLGAEETTVLKSLLHRLLDGIDPDATSMWDAESEKQSA